MAKKSLGGLPGMGFMHMLQGMKPMGFLQMMQEGLSGSQKAKKAGGTQGPLAKGNNAAKKVIEESQADFHKRQRKLGVEP